MKLFNTPSFPSQILAGLGAKAMVYAFTGVAPENVEDITFDYNDYKELEKQAASIHYVGWSQIDGYLIKVANEGTVKRPIGYAMDNAVGSYLVSPKSFTYDPSHAKAYMFEDVDYHASMMSLDGYTKNIGDSQDKYFEYDFGMEVTIDRIHTLHYTSTTYSITDFELQRFDGSDWVTCEQNTFVFNSLGTSKAYVELSAAYTATKFRIVPKTTLNLYQGGFTFYSSVEPASNAVAEPYTWFLIRSRDEYADAEDVPVVIGNAGGPNSNKEMALTHYDSEPAAEVKLLNFKLKSLVMNEVV